MITNVITADNDKKTIFGKEYIEVLLPIGDEGFEILEAKCPDVLKPINKCLDDEDTETAWVDSRLPLTLRTRKRTSILSQIAIIIMNIQIHGLKVTFTEISPLTAKPPNISKTRQ